MADVATLKQQIAETRARLSQLRAELAEALPKRPRLERLVECSRCGRVLVAGSRDDWRTGGNHYCVTCAKTI